MSQSHKVTQVTQVTRQHTSHMAQFSEFDEFIIKIAPIRAPEFGGAMKNPYLCNVVQKSRQRDGRISSAGDNLFVRRQTADGPAERQSHGQLTYY